MRHLYLSTDREIWWRTPWNQSHLCPKLFQGWGGVDHAGVGWVIQGWGGVGHREFGGSCRGGVDCVMHGWGGVDWVMQGWGGAGEIIDVASTWPRCSMMPIVVIWVFYKVLFGMGWSCRGGVGHTGEGCVIHGWCGGHAGVRWVIHGRGWVGQAGVGCVMEGWGGSYMGGVGWVRQGWGGSCRGGCVIQGWGGSRKTGWGTLK